MNFLTLLEIHRACAIKYEAERIEKKIKTINKLETKAISEEAKAYFRTLAKEYQKTREDLLKGD